MTYSMHPPERTMIGEDERKQRRAEERRADPSVRGRVGESETDPTRSFRWPRPMATSNKNGRKGWFDDCGHAALTVLRKRACVRALSCFTLFRRPRSLQETLAASLFSRDLVSASRIVERLSDRPTHPSPRQRMHAGEVQQYQQKTL